MIPEVIILHIGLLVLICMHSPPMMLWEACSTEKRDNLLVETNIFCHFRGLILRYANGSNNPINLKEYNVKEQFRKSSIPLCSPLFYLMELLIPFTLHK